MISLEAANVSLPSYTCIMDVRVENSSSFGVTFPQSVFSLDRKQTEMKRGEIVRACDQGNLKQLVELASSPGGLLEDKLRQSAWPILLGYGQQQTRLGQPDDAAQELPAHPDEEQVQRDVDRAFVYYPNNESAKRTEARKKSLFALITQILRRHPTLCYFQGYHDIVQVIMLVLGSEAAFPAVESISLLRIRDYMLSSLTPALKHLQLVPCILQAADKELANHLSMPHPNYALPAALTLYAHEIQEYSDIARLFDFLLAHEPVMSLYLFAAIIISRRSDLLEIPPDEHDMLFFTLQKLPQPLDLEPLIQGALRLFRDHPPERLSRRVWQRMSSSSVLKTSRSLEHPESINAAEKYLKKQAEEVRWEERKQKALRSAFRHKRPLATTALAVAIGAMSLWLRRSGNDRLIVSFLMSAIGWARGR